ncbi:MAG: DMT family transporter [Pseudomonadota bacterium]
MGSRELAVFLSMCLVWGFHFVVIKTAVGALPPIYYAAIRMTLVAAVLAIFLRWRSGHMVRVLSGGLCLGALNYALMFSGVKFATASVAAVAMELYVPFATILSIVFLGDKLGWRRAVGIGLAFAGVAIIALGKQDDAGTDTRIALGVGLVAAGAFTEAVGAVLVKKSTAFKPLELLAWFSLVGASGLWILTFLFETGQGEAFAAADKTLIGGAILYSALGGSIFGHTAYYWLLQRLPVSVVAPSALLTTLLAVIFSVLLLGDPFGPPMIIGGLMTLAGVGIVLIRTARKADMKAPVIEADVVP